MQYIPLIAELRVAPLPAVLNSNVLTAIVWLLNVWLCMQADAEYWKRSEGYRVGWSDEILGFDCGGEQWVLEVAFPTGTLKCGSNPTTCHTLLLSAQGRFRCSQPSIYFRRISHLIFHDSHRVSITADCAKQFFMGGKKQDLSPPLLKRCTPSVVCFQIDTTILPCLQEAQQCGPGFHEGPDAGDRGGRRACAVSHRATLDGFQQRVYEPCIRARPARHRALLGRHHHVPAH